MKNKLSKLKKTIEVFYVKKTLQQTVTLGSGESLFLRNTNI